MRGTKAKTLRRAAYGDRATNARGRGYLIDGGTIITDEHRCRYQFSKGRTGGKYLTEKEVAKLQPVSPEINFSPEPKPTETAPLGPYDDGIPALRFPAPGVALGVAIWAVLAYLSRGWWLPIVQGWLQ